MQYSILMPFAPTRPEQVLPYAAFTQWSGAHRLWKGQAGIADPHQTFAFAAGSGFRVPAGIGVTLMPYRHPYQAALQAQSLAQATAHPVLAGYGPGAVGLQRSMLGAPYRSPLTASREYLTIVRRLLDGETVEHDGEYFSCHVSLVPSPVPPIEVGLGVLRPGMARLAGEVADVAITWLTPAGYVRDVVLPALREGAERAGRPVPRVTAIMPVAVAKEARDPLVLAMGSTFAHLRMPHYADMLRRSGIDVDIDDPGTTGKSLIEGGAFLYGKPDELGRRFEEFEQAGVDELVLNATGVYGQFGSGTVLADMEAVLPEGGTAR